MPTRKLLVGREQVLPQLRRAFWLGAIGLIAVGFTFALLYSLSQRSIGWVLQSQNVDRVARESRNLVHEREAAVRARLRSADSLPVPPRTALMLKLDSLMLLTQRNASQHDRARAIRSAVNAWERAWVAPTLAAAGTRRPSAAISDDLAGPALLQSVQAAFGSFIAGEKRIFDRRVAMQRFLQRFTFYAISLEIALLIGVLAWLSRRSLTQAKVLLEQQEQLQVQSIDLQHQATELEERTMELEAQTEQANRVATALATSNENLERTINRLKATQAIADTTRSQKEQLEEQLAQSQKMEAVGRLAGGVAHDFNNMLTAIKSYSELLLADMKPGSPQSADMLEIIKAADRASALTRQLLAFSRQQVLRPQLVNMNDTVEGLQKMLQRLAGKRIDLSLILAPRVWTVTADPAELERVIMNLVLNARDAMPEGGRLIIETSNVDIDPEYAAAHADTQPGPYVMLAVTDTGGGMTKEVRERLFEPFFTTKEKGKGTGLGLASVYGIVKQSGGFVWVYSEPGRGTTFKVYLPRATESPARLTPTPRTNRPIGAETILLVEDDDEVRHVATRILRRNGYRVLDAANGADALRICESEQEPIDLIITDLVMPEMGGSELAQRIRKLEPEARILFTSGYTEDAVVRQSFLNPGEAFIEKPFTPASLAQKAREVLDAQSGQRDVVRESS